MSEKSWTGMNIVRRADYRLEYAEGTSWRREASVELDLTAVIIRSGRYTALVGEEQFVGSGPILLLVNPGVTFAIDGESDDGVYSHLSLSLRPPAIDRAATALDLDNRTVVVFGESRAAVTEATSLSAARVIAEFRRNRPGREAAFDLLAALLSIDLVRDYASAERSARVERSRVGLVDRRLRRAVEFMHDNFERELATGEIAAAAYLSEFHFARLFKRLTGQTPHAYLASIRIAAAERLLAETDLSISEVGARVGYQSPSHFAKVFRAATGLTPTAFREVLVR